MNDNKEIERAHHPYSPSTLQNLEACDCWQGVQSDNPHPRTIIGTLSHACLETGEDNLSLGDEDAEKAAECIDFFNERKGYAEEWRADRMRLENKEYPPVLELKETYLPIDGRIFPDGVVATTAGYIDCAILSHDRTYAEAFDWKFGMWPVEKAENNLQGIAYVLGMFRMFPLLQSVRFWFKQPNIGVLTSHLFKRDDIAAHYLRIQVVVAKARAARERMANGKLPLEEQFSTARPMVPACNFCAHIAKCPKVTEFACRVGSKFFPLEIPASITPTQVHNAKDTTLGLRLSAVMSVWAESFKKLITERIIRRDAPVPDGFVLQSRSNRKIIDEKKFKEAALSFLTIEEYEATLEPAFGKTEKKISEKAPRGQKQASVEAFSGKLEEVGAVKRGDAYTFLRAVSTK